MSIKAAQRYTKAVGDVRTVTLSLRDELSSGELLTGTPTAVEVTTSDLTISAVAVNTVAVPVDKVFPEEVAIGQAVQCLVAGGVAGTTYEILISASTDAAQVQTFKRVIVMDVTAN